MVEFLPLTWVTRARFLDEADLLSFFEQPCETLKLARGRTTYILDKYHICSRLGA